MQSNYQNIINKALGELAETRSISSALLVCNTLLEYMGVETKNIEDIELSKFKLPNAERYDRWFEAHPHFRGDRACFELLTKEEKKLEAKFFALQKKSKLFIAGAVNFTPNFEDRDYTRNDPNMKVGIDFFLTPEKNSVIVVLSNKGNLRLVELSGRLTNTQNEIFILWEDIAKKSEDKNIFHLTIWDSFKLSSLNKKFYEGMVNSFTTLTQHLQTAGVENQLANQFANRMLGRLLFLWFLRKKHIINEEKEYFLIDCDDNAYYQNKLSVLFFNVLNNESHKDFDSVTPYLNGGLFDQKADGAYWNNHKPTFPVGFFKALYAHFDAFNFTTDESTPEYEQIAIDPEMLGRIFESFLATLTTETGAQAKKANGAFYTPREIVAYMSRESLRQYLYTKLEAGEILKKSIDDLLDLPDHEWAIAGTNSKRDAVDKEDRERIITALREMKVLDPAVGSGAFPMGVLHKMLSVLERLESNFDSYEAKLAILKNNIYGVDIDPTAIEISRLRAWLSIIVDVKVKDTKKIEPLPNLEFKFVCANSLIGLDTSKQMSITGYDQNLKTELMRIRDEYYAKSNKKTKEKLQKEYIKLTHPNQSSLLDTEETRQLKSYQPFENGKCASFYDPELMHGVENFNIIIGNPPYGAKLDKLQKDIYKVKFADVHMRTPDTLNYFISRSIRMLNNNFRGTLSFIVSNNLLFQHEYFKTRELFLKSNKVLKVLNLGDQVFESAIIPSCIFLLSNEFLEKYDFKFADLRLHKNNLSSIDFNSLLMSFSKEDIIETPDYVFGVEKSSIDIIKKVEAMSIKVDDIAEEMACGISSGGDKIFRVSVDTINDLSLEKDLLHDVLVGREMNSYQINKTSHSIIYTTRETDLDKYPNIKKYLLKFKNKLSLRSECKSGILPWFSLNRQRYSKLFEDDKLIFRQTSDSIKVAFDDSGCYALDSVLILKLKNDCKYDYKFILGILNSKLINFIYKEISQESGRVFAQVKPQNIRKLYIPKIGKDEQDGIVGVVNELLLARKSDLESDTKNLESQIDQLIYQLYGLTEDEIKIVEDSNKK